jgi:hypothetical protein
MAPQHHSIRCLTDGGRASDRTTAAGRGRASLVAIGTDALIRPASPARTGGSQGGRRIETARRGGRSISPGRARGSGPTVRPTARTVRAVQGRAGCASPNPVNAREARPVRRRGRPNPVNAREARPVRRRGRPNPVNAREARGPGEAREAREARGPRESHPPPDPSRAPAPRRIPHRGSGALSLCREDQAGRAGRLCHIQPFPREHRRPRSPRARS